MKEDDEKLGKLIGLGFVWDKSKNDYKALAMLISALYRSWLTSPDTKKTVPPKLIYDTDSESDIIKFKLVAYPDRLMKLEDLWRII